MKKPPLLAEYGIELTTFQLGHRLNQMLNNFRPGWSIDKLVTNPVQAIKFCKMVRGQKRYAMLPDEAILRSLLAGRNRSKQLRERVDAPRD